MQFSILSLITFAAALASVEATKGKPLTKICHTSFSSKTTKHIKTTTKYHTLTATETKTVYKHPTVTVTPSITSTSTSTVTSTVVTTDPTITDTATITDTVFTTQTSTADTSTMVITATETETVSTTTTQTSTVAAPTGFAPIDSTLPGAMAKKRELASPEQLKARNIFERSTKPKKLCDDKSKYPVAVECEVYTTTTKTKTITKTQKPCTKTARPTTVTATSTTTFSTTSTVFPPEVTSTETATSTSTVVTTSTPITSSTTTVTTVTTTTVAAATTPTVYAQCQSDNLASQGPTAGQYFTNGFPQYTEDGGAMQLTTDTAYDCCVACAMDPTCIIGGFVTGGTCIFRTASSIDQCAAGQAAKPWAAQNSGDTAFFSLFNGACGEFNSYTT